MKGVPANVAVVFASWPPPAKRRALAIRGMIIDIPATLQKTHALRSPLEETLKWGEPAYLLKSRQHVADMLEAGLAG